MKHVVIADRAGTFAENKDVARNIRVQETIPALERSEEVILDFEKVEAATQSFIHALISDILRRYGNDALDRISFKSCNDTTKKIINIVVDYMQEGMGIDTEDNRPYAQLYSAAILAFGRPRCQIFATYAPRMSSKI